MNIEPQAQSCAIEQGDPGQARSLSEKMHAAAWRYWETSAPELLDAPVTWLAPGSATTGPVHTS